MIWADISDNPGVSRYRCRSAQPAVHRDSRLLLRQASGAGERHLHLRHRHWNVRLRAACQLFGVRIRLESRSACQRNHSCAFKPELTVDHVTHWITDQWPTRSMAWPTWLMTYDPLHWTFREHTDHCKKWLHQHNGNSWTNELQIRTSDPHDPSEFYDPFHRWPSIHSISVSPVLISRKKQVSIGYKAVSYTHLTLPTIYSV